jgi:hypothetical protein
VSCLPTPLRSGTRSNVCSAVQDSDTVSCMCRTSRLITMQDVNDLLDGVRVVLSTTDVPLMCDVGNSSLAYCGASLSAVMSPPRSPAQTSQLFSSSSLASFSDSVVLNRGKLDKLYSSVHDDVLRLGELRSKQKTMLCACEPTSASHVNETAKIQLGGSSSHQPPLQKLNGTAKILSHRPWSNAEQLSQRTADLFEDYQSFVGENGSVLVDLEVEDGAAAGDWTADLFGSSDLAQIPADSDKALTDAAAVASTERQRVKSLISAIAVRAKVRDAERGGQDSSISTDVDVVRLPVLSHHSVKEFVPVTEAANQSAFRSEDVKLPQISHSKTAVGGTVLNLMGADSRLLPSKLPLSPRSPSSQPSISGGDKKATTGTIAASRAAAWPENVSMESTVAMPTGSRPPSQQRAQVPRSLGKSDIGPTSSKPGNSFETTVEQKRRQDIAHRIAALQEQMESLLDHGVRSVMDEALFASHCTDDAADDLRVHSRTVSPPGEQINPFTDEITRLVNQSRWVDDEEDTVEAYGRERSDPVAALGGEEITSTGKFVIV